MEEWLESTYRKHPHAGVHCAARWLLRSWGQTDKVQALDRELATEGAVGDRAWFINSLGITMVVVRGPTRFMMGASAAEASPHAFENRHEHHIPWSFAVSAAEITCDQFAEFAPGYLRNRSTASSGDCPATGVTWRDALDFCRWLSREESMSGVDTDAVQPLADDAYQVNCDLTGYRLPTSAEWECACRAGTTTSRFCGENATPFLNAYAWWSDSEQRFAPVASKAPNLWGLFDCYGNAEEWVATRFAASAASSPAEVPVIHLSNDAVLFLRGGGYDRREAFFRSASAIPMFAAASETMAWSEGPIDASRTDGFRIVRTLK